MESLKAAVLEALDKIGGHGNTNQIILYLRPRMRIDRSRCRLALLALVSDGLVIHDGKQRQVGNCTFSGSPAWGNNKINLWRLAAREAKSA